MKNTAIADAIHDPERYTLITALLHSAFTRNKHGEYLKKHKKFVSRISLSQLVNRVFLLFQSPLIFSYYENIDNKWVLRGHTLNDKTFEKKFQLDFLKKHHEKNNNREYILKNSDYVLPFNNKILGKYAIGLIQLSRMQDGNSVQMTFNVCKKGDDYFEMLNTLIEHFLDSPFSKEIGLLESIGKPNQLLNSIYCNPRSTPDHWNISLKGTHQRAWGQSGESININDFTNEQIVEIRSITNDIYKKVSDDFIVSNSGKRPPNIFFFLRYYDPIDFKEEKNKGTNKKTYKLKPRYKKQYAYSLRRILPKIQRDDLTSTLESIHEISRHTLNNKKWKFLARDKDNNDIGMETNGIFPNEHQDRHFWDDLKKVDNNNEYDKKINELEEPFPNNFKSIVDPVFLNSFIHIRNNPFSGSASDRIDVSDNEEYEWDPKITPQILYTYYLYAAAAKSSKSETLSVMTVPLKVSGVCYMTVSHVINVTDSLFRNAIEWKRNYFFFSNVVSNIRRQLRKKTERGYYKQLEINILRCLIIYLEDNSMTTEKLSKMANDNNYQLCRVWPFAQLKIVVYDSLDRPEDFREYDESLSLLGDDFRIAWKQIQNPFYLDSELQYRNKSILHNTMESIVNQIENYTMILAQRNNSESRLVS